MPVVCVCVFLLLLQPKNEVGARILLCSVIAQETQGGKEGEKIPFTVTDCLPPPPQKKKDERRGSGVLGGFKGK